MKEKEFKDLYDKFKPEKTNISFTEKQWDEAIKKWEEYRKDIISDNGLPIDRWLKNDGGYLPDFLDTKEKKFGHARIGNYKQVMIYKHTGPGEHCGKYYNNTEDKNKWLDNKDDLTDDYNKYIRDLLKKIVKAETCDDIYKKERLHEYKEFDNYQILRKITILESVMENSNYKNQFMWFYNDGTLNKLANILDVDDDANETTFLEKNKKIYDKAKKYADINNNSNKKDFIKLYCFLCFLSDESVNVPEFSDFHNVNVIFNGAPGTGKTYGVKKGIEILQKLNKEKFKDLKYIQFHPSYTYQDFIEGIKPLGIKSGNLDLQVVNGSFKQFCINVKKENENYYKGLPDKEKPNVEDPSTFKDWPHYYFVVDEINRGNLSNIFGETFTLLEYRDYDFSGNYDNNFDRLISTTMSNVVASLDDDKLIYKKIGDNVYFGIPFNIHFIGIMNDVDRSIDPFDLAFRRRFKWISKYCDYDVIENELSLNKYKDDDIEEYIKSCKKLNEMIYDSNCDEGLKLGRSYEIGHAFFLRIKEISKNKITKDNKKMLFENYISGTLKEYIRQVADENEIDSWLDKAREAFGIK